MRRSPFSLVFLSILGTAVVLFLAGCGGNASPAPSSSSPSPTAATPTPTPPASGGSGSGGGTPAPAAPATTQWQAAISTNHGSLTVSTAGDVGFQLTGATANAHYTLQFCQFMRPIGSSTAMCFDLVPVTVDASGNAQQSFHFPKPGKWSGQFGFFDASINRDAFGTGPTTTESLISANSINGGLFTSSTATDPLKSGTVTTDGNTTTITLNGAVANATYNFIQSGTGGSSSSYMDGSEIIKTDANGNATFTGKNPAPPYASDFEILRNSNVEFVSGFTVP